MARRADIHLQLRPGTNVAVLNGLMHVILEEGLADEAFIAERTEGFDELPAVLAAYTPELVEEITGVPADDAPRGGAPVRHGRARRHRLLDGHHPALARHRARAGGLATSRC